MDGSRLGPTFWRFWSASAVSQLGDGIRITALPLLAASITTDPVPVAAVSAAVWLPWLVFGGIGGAIVDRVDRRALMRNGQLARALITALLVAAISADLETIPLLLVVAVALGIVEVMVDSALYSVIPRIVASDRLEAANGRVGAAEQVGNELVGPPLGGLLFAGSRLAPFAVDCVSFALSATLLQTVAGDFRPPTRATTSIWADIKDGFRWLLAHRVLRPMALGLGAMTLSTSVAWGVLVLFALQVLDVSSVGFGLLASATAVGGIGGNLLGSRIAIRIGRRPAMLLPLAATGVATILVGFTSNAFAAGALFFVEGLMIGIFNVVARSLRQLMTPDRLLGRVTSSFRILSYGMAAVGSLIGGFVAEAIGLRAPWIIAGALATLAAIVTAFVITEDAIEDALAAVDRAG